MDNTLEERLKTIEERNLRVEADKAWEVSFARRASISAITYAVAFAALWSIGSPNSYLSAFIPVIGYVLSTQSLPLLKSWWLRYRPKR